MDDKYKPQKKPIEFERHREPVERRYRVNGREITLLVRAEGKRTFESQWDIDRRRFSDGYYPIPARPGEHFPSALKLLI